MDLNFYSELDNGGTIEFWTDFFSDLEYFDIGDRIKLILLMPLAIPMAILEFVVIKPLEFFMHTMEKGDKIKYFIRSVCYEYIVKISEEEFESEIRKIIIDTINEIDKKIIKLN